MTGAAFLTPLLIAMAPVPPADCDPKTGCSVRQKCNSSPSGWCVVDWMPDWNRAWSQVCVGLYACDSPQEEARCIWRSDGTVEAKNATCADDRRGVRK